MRSTTHRWALILGAGALLCGCALTRPAVDPAALERRVMDTERAFAATMAARDFAAFATFIDPEAVFFDGEVPLRGRQAVLAHWSRYFTSSEAPFSWAPDRVVVLDSGRLALSTGPVYGPGGRPVARFNSIWRQRAEGQWQVVFDKGSPLPRQSGP